MPLAGPYRVSSSFILEGTPSSADSDDVTCSSKFSNRVTCGDASAQRIDAIVCVSSTLIVTIATAIKTTTTNNNTKQQQQRNHNDSIINNNKTSSGSSNNVKNKPQLERNPQPSSPEWGTTRRTKQRASVAMEAAAATTAYLPLCASGSISSQLRALLQRNQP